VPTPTGEREGGAGSKESEISEAAAEGSVPQVLKNLQEEDLRDLQEEDSYNSLHSGSGCPLAPSHAHSLARARALSLSLSLSLPPSPLPLLLSRALSLSPQYN